MKAVTEKTIPGK